MKAYILVGLQKNLPKLGKGVLDKFLILTIDNYNLRLLMTLVGFLISFLIIGVIPPLTMASKVDEKSLLGVYTFGFGVSKYVLPSKSSIKSNNTFL